MLFLDSADVAEARAAAALPFVGGVSCNPSLLARALGASSVTLTDFATHVKALADAHHGALFVQTLAPDTEGMVLQAHALREVVPVDRLVIKIPYTEAGLRAARVLAVDKVPVCVTAVFSVMQAYVAATCGAHWIAPYCNRVTAHGGDGVATVRAILDTLRAHDLGSRLLVASIKSVPEMEDVLRTGAHHVTVGLDLLRAAARHELADQAMERFSQDLRITTPG
jgi:TalC/MipB family fructose-6-phosphate aldolase